LESQLKKSLAMAIGFLETHNYAYAVIGGLANQIWGEPRLTYDVDLKVVVPDLDYDALRSHIRKAFPRRGRPGVPEIPLLIDALIEGVVVDFLLAIPGYEENIIARAVRMDLGGLSVRICTAEDLIIQKAVAGRPKDWQDIQGVIVEQQENLDYAYLEDWLEQFAEVLDRPEIFDHYREIRQRVIRAADTGE